MAYKIIKSQDNITVRQYNKALNGDLSVLIEGEYDGKLENNAAMIARLNDAYLTIFDQFNTTINNPLYRLNVNSNKNILLMQAKIANLEYTNIAISIIIGLVDTCNPFLIDINKIIETNCKNRGIRFDGDYVDAKIRIKAKIELLEQKIEIERTRIPISEPDNEGNNSLIELLAFCINTGANINEDSTLALLGCSVNQINKKKK